MYCRECGAMLSDNNSVCPHCGKRFSQIIQCNDSINPPVFKSAKDFNSVAGFLLLGFLGIGGLHRFYVGREISGLLYFLTGGVGYLGTLYDAYLLYDDQFLDGHGYPVMADKDSSKKMFKKICIGIILIGITLIGIICLTGILYAVLSGGVLDIN